MGPDLLVDRLDRPTLESVFAELIDSGCLRPEWEVLPDGGIRISKSILWEKNSPRLGDLLAFLEHHDQLCRNKDLADFVQMTRGGFLDLNGLNATDFNGIAEAILDFYSRFDAFSFIELYSCTSLVVLLTEDLRISSPTKLRAMELVSKYRSTFKTRIAARERRLARRKDAQQKESDEK